MKISLSDAWWDFVESSIDYQARHNIDSKVRTAAYVVLSDIQNQRKLVKKMQEMIN